MRRILGVLTLALLTACFEKSTNVAGGGGIETTDGQIAAVTGWGAGARVRLVPADYLPLLHDSFPDSLSAIANDSGRYAFHGIPAGSYNLEAVSPGEGSRLLALRRDIAGVGQQTLTPASLTPPGRLRLMWEGSHHGYLFIRGTTILRRILPAETEMPVLQLDSLPEGTLPPLRWAQSKTDTLGIAITDSLHIASDSVTDVSVYAAWAHAGRAYLNTSASGIALSGDIAGFPVLVRLTASTFDFSQAAADGGDVRFSDRDGAELDFQIERWNAPAGLAEIWVRLPRVRANDTGETFAMHWGNPAAGSRSSGPKTFGNGTGLLADWHLAGSASALPGGYLDATPNGFHGSALPPATPTAFEGGIAGCAKLEGAQRIMVPDAAALNPTGAITVSAWIKADAWSGGNRRIVQKGIGMTQYALAGFGADSVEWRLVLSGAQFSLRAPAPALADWHLVAGTYDGKRSAFYIDGSLAVSSDATGPIGVSTDSLAIGFAPSGPDNQYFQGLIDEVAVSGMPRSADWIKLAYATQRPGATALRLVIRK